MVLVTIQTDWKEENKKEDACDYPQATPLPRSCVKIDRGLGTSINIGRNNTYSNWRW